VESVESLFLRFLAIDLGLAFVLALWSIATHLHASFDAFPYLGVTSPTKRCGKTRLCELLSFVCRNPRQTVGISPAALFRLIKLDAPTLLIDEAECLNLRTDERASMLREILNAGYRKGQHVYRCRKTKKEKEEETYEPEPFETYSPKALVLIGKLPGTLADRCIEIRMERRATCHIERFRHERVRSQTESLRSEVRRWAGENVANVLNYYEANDVPSLQDREAELWLPLFSVCAVAAPDRLSELERLATRIASAKAADDPGDSGIRLLADIKQIISGTKYTRIPTSVLIERLNGMEESGWSGWFRGQGLNPHSLAHMLRAFGIQPQNIRDGGRVVKGYLRETFEAAWERYLPK
jgi:hypothetical protein